MAQSPKIRVNPSLLIWARESTGIDTEEVAKRFGVKEKLVEDWEKGSQPITYRRLEGLADYYKRPIAVFFLPNVPQESLTPTDFRSPKGEKIVMSKELRLVVRRARFLRNAFLEIYPEYKRLVPHNVKLTENPEHLAFTQREKLNLPFIAQSKWHAGRESLMNFIKVLEAQGVLVLQHNFPEKEISGFSLGDTDKPPVIVLNSQDSFARRIFTLFHEYCHILLNESGICKLRYDSKELGRNDSVENFCDKFSSNFLIPNNIFLEQSEIRRVTGKLEDEAAIQKLANLFKVSRQAILLRLLNEKKISYEYYEEKRVKFDNEYYASLKKIKEKQKKTPGGPPPYILAVSQNGHLFSKAAVQAFRSGKISSKEVSNYLGVKLDHLANVESML